MHTISTDIRDFPADVQDLLRDRAVKTHRPIEEVIRDYVLESARLIKAAALEPQSTEASHT